MNRTIKQTRIVIAGGGFAGLYAARYLDKRLARRSDIEVTLISRENFILFTPMLHEAAAGDRIRRRRKQGLPMAVQAEPNSVLKAKPDKP
jgi:NADH dehydrogenase FAD-containing subunit